jgi:hypothetical protein
VTNRSKERGTKWESEIVEFLAPLFPHVERRALRGNSDRGDIAGLPGCVIEAKHEARTDLSGWLNEAQTEGRNAAARLAVVWFKRRGKASAGDGYVLMDGHAFAYLLKEAGW